ncbi:SARP family transcriptional regulator [Plantactinospora endophytica]|uniref:SARP family transcriptional regulator n=1 Tax=Plantactinospora endophytica TaxID=673535 RepID=A0ABQ4E762_9ACTN|nr:SARP family transcriptional regulator [Plantactinospora endophytica]
MLKAYREKAGLTQSELADRTGLSAAAIRDLEQRRSRGPRTGSVRALAVALGLNPAETRTFRAAVGPARPETRVAEPDATVRVGVLGPLVVYRGTTEMALGTGRHRVVLARLALTPRVAVHRDELIDLLWGDRVPPSAVNLVQTHVSRLRRLLSPGAVVLTAGGYRLELGADEVDQATFRALTGSARTADRPDAALDLLDQALGLWRGEPCADVEEVRGHPAAAALQEERATATMRHADLADALSRNDLAPPRLIAVATVRPLDEPLHARLITALGATGRRAAALSAYHDIRRRLREELGVDPGTELAEAYRAVLRQEPAEDAAVDSTPRPWQAPAPPGDFTGRTEEVGTLLGLLSRQPTPVCLVSGVAGVGKTTLALRAAQLVRSAYPDGQLYIDLAGAGARPLSPAEALARFLRALAVEDRRIPKHHEERAALFRSITAERRVLVILDNARDAAQVRPLLPGPGGSVALITSRWRLPDLAGVAVVDLAPFSPDEAVGLLAATAGAARVAVEPEAVAELATACAGLPIALRVAGARLANRPGWTVRDLVDRLDDQRDRLAELQVGDVGVAASFALSYLELPVRTARAFRLLALLPGTDFVAPIAAATLDLTVANTVRELEDLIDGNLLQPAGDGRYRYHDLLRIFALGRLDAEEPADRRAEALRNMLDGYLARVAAAAELIYPSMVRLPVPNVDTGAFRDAAEATVWLDAELPALVAAVEEAAERDDHRAYAWQLADQLRGYFFVRRHSAAWLATGRAGLTAAETAGEGRGRAAMHQTIGQALWSLGQAVEALAEYEQALALAERHGWPEGEAYLLHNIGLVQKLLGRLPEARSWYRRALTVSRACGCIHVEAVTLNDLGAMLVDEGRAEDAAAHFAAALRLNEGRAAGRQSAAGNRSNLGMALRMLGRMAEAREHLEEALAYFVETRSPTGQLCVLDELSQMYAALGEHDAAVDTARRALALTRTTGDQRAQAELLFTLGDALLSAHSLAEAERCFGEAYALGERLGYPLLRIRAGLGLARAELAAGRGVEALLRARAMRAEAVTADFTNLAEEADQILGSAVR